MKDKKGLCICDIDGTLDVANRVLSAEIYRMSKVGVDFITATGRTNSYVKEVCKKYDIMPPRFIIADNGGTIYDNRTNRYLKRRCLEIHKRRRILEEYIRLGGRLDDVRYTDGDNVYAAEDLDVRKYYEAEGIIEYRTNQEILDEILAEDKEITKVTLAGSKKLMQDIIQFIAENDISCWTDIGATKFPTRIRKNYRLDITDGETSKGEAVEFLMNYTHADRFTCVGNGPNDFSMFKFALDSNMPIIVVRNFENGKVTKESQEVIEMVQDYAKQVGRLENVTIASFPINSYIGKSEQRKSAKQRREGFTSKLRVEGVPKADTAKKGSQGRVMKVQDRGGK